ncbi:MAG: hypothetical protein CFK49_03085 [Armatimonadetes bacterium JP3_11]|jgi:hypothetical protein|nr:MAG: hypothetical protein CFK48_07550 [Armatimonadetes bacterium CP1_7O]OYT75462.1 MAG: hypothetical protein CFK49_03085 [Armatimonadetes bacterium JP3_11]RMH07219.1 MAG: hypothetical protein D6697_09125 [Armatimonadota bacterium]
MSELMVLLQALLLIAGWLLFLRAQTELRAQAARQSLTGELEELRQTVDTLLQRLIEEAAHAEARIEARLRELERRDATIQSTQAYPQTQGSEPDAPVADSETFSHDSGYNLSGSSPYGVVAMLAEQGLSVPEIARQTGYAPGEVELILNLKQRIAEENG